MNELQQYLKSYLGIPSSELETIASMFQETKLSKNDFFVEQYHYCNQLSFIKSGYLRVFAETEQKEITQWISTASYFVTDISSLIFDTPSRFSIQALTDCELYTISKSDYKSIGNYVANWNVLEKLFIAKCFVTLENRVFALLSKSAEEKYHRLFSENPDLFNRVPLQYLASMMGMTPETLSRIRKKSVKPNS